MPTTHVLLVPKGISHPGIETARHRPWKCRTRCGPGWETMPTRLCQWAKTLPTRQHGRHLPEVTAAIHGLGIANRPGPNAMSAAPGPVQRRRRIPTSMEEASRTRVPSRGNRPDDRPLNHAVMVNQSRCIPAYFALLTADSRSGENRISGEIECAIFIAEYWSNLHGAISHLMAHQARGGFDYDDVRTSHHPAGAVPDR